MEIINFEVDNFNTYASSLHYRNKEQALLGLANAIATSPDLQEIPLSLIVAKYFPSPRIALFGHFNDDQISYLSLKANWLNATCEKVKYVNYAQVEQDVDQLAKKLLDKFSRAELHRFAYTGIPRGGLIVLGLLTIILGIPANRVQALNMDDSPIVVVDDCALTGARFHNFINNNRLNLKNTIFSHLYSHTKLRQNISKDVLDCISSHDLTNFFDTRKEEDKERIKQKFSEIDNFRYWIGQTDHICFPWNEPDRLFWNPILGKYEKGWSVVPPSLCMKNQPLSNTKSRTVQLQPSGKGPLRPSENVIFGEINGQIVIGNVKNGSVIQLSNVAADTWRLMIKYGHKDLIFQNLYQIYEIDSSTLQNDLSSLIHDFSSRELIEFC